MKASSLERNGRMEGKGTVDESEGCEEEAAVNEEWRCCCWVQCWFINLLLCDFTAFRDWELS